MKRSENNLFLPYSDHLFDAALLWFGICCLQIFMAHDARSKRFLIVAGPVGCVKMKGAPAKH